MKFKFFSNNIKLMLCVLEGSRERYMSMRERTLTGTELLLDHTHKI